MAGSRRGVVAATARPRLRRSRVHRKPTLRKRIKTAVLLATLVAATTVATAMLYLLLLFVRLSHDLPSLDQVGNVQASHPTTIYYSDGQILATLPTIDRKPVKLDQVNPYVRNATVAVEDRRFYQHNGIDLHGIIRAAYHDVTHGDPSGQGASTITQQLARNTSSLGLTRGKHLDRKIREALLAIKIEQSFSKDEILEAYLNQIYYGEGAHGVEAGAEVYFHKTAAHLTLAQAAMLAGLPQRPSYFSSPLHRDAAMKRRSEVLQSMVETGKITQADADHANSIPLVMYRARPERRQVFGAPHFVTYVISRVIREAAAAQGYTSDDVYNGLKIYTTLDSRIQHAAETAVHQGLRNYGGGVANQGALVCVDPVTGNIRALVGNVDFHQDQYNVVTQGKRQPGSSFKPIVYTAAFDTGKCELDTEFRDDPYFPGYQAYHWKPKNYSGRYSYSDMTVEHAIHQSVNTIAVKVAMAVGLKTVIAYAQRLGITTPLHAFPSLALGAGAVRPIDMAKVYSCFATFGKRPSITAYTRVITPEGDTILDTQPPPADTKISQHAYESINQALRGVVTSGTGQAAEPVPDAHGKTGTTSDDRDAWFAGYTPDLVTIVWASHENRDRKGRLSRKQPYAAMPGTTGGSLCAPIWRDFMLQAVPIQQQSKQRPKQPTAAPESPKKSARSADGGTVPFDTASKPFTPKFSPPPGNPTGQPAVDPNLLPPPVTGTGAVNTSGTGQSALQNLLPGAPSTTRPAAAVPPAATTPARTSAGTGTNQPNNPTPVASRVTPRQPAAPRENPRDRLVIVRLCVDSGGRATPWCDTTVLKQMRARDVPGRCRMHHPPPGER